MQCLTQQAGIYTISNPQPVVVGDCFYILATPQELPTGIMNLTPAEGLRVGGLLTLVLVAGFSIRAMARALNIYEGSQNE